MIQIFAHQDDVARLEALLPQQNGAEYCRTLNALAWYLRQQDALRAEQMLSRLEPLLSADLAAPEQEAMRLRASLIRTELQSLLGQLQSAYHQVETILQRASELGDAILSADAHWIAGFIAAEMGDEPRRAHHRQAGLQLAQGAGDSVRAQIAELSQAYFDVVTDPQCRQWDFWKNVDVQQLHPASQVWLNNLLGLLAAQRGESISNWIRSFDLAMQTGQLRLAILVATNIGDVLNELNDYESALEWNLRGLELARPTGWISSIGMSLLQTGQTMRQLGRLDSAEELLREGLQLLEAMPHSRAYSIGMMYLGELALIQGKPQQALQYFEIVEKNASNANQVDFQILVWRGHAMALLRTGEQARALQAAHHAWEWARTLRDPKREIEVLKVLAEIYAQTDLPEPLAAAAGLAHCRAWQQADPAQRQNLPPALIFLLMALQLGQQIAGYNIDGDLYDALAEQYARRGDFAKAYDMARQGGISRETTHSAQATQSAIAAQVRYATERARVEGERAQQLASEKARHLAALQQTRTTLEHLETIGQEMTAQLDLTALYRILDLHLHQLLEIHVFAVYLLDPAQQVLIRVFGVENGVALPVRTLALDSPDADSVRCLRQRQAMVRDWSPQQHYPNQEQGTLETLSALYAPLAVGSRVLGVMSVQSLQRHAFGEREQLIFYTLCSYAAISFDNAHAYQQLLQAQAELAEQEKRAALGGLVAGVAHEMNTPLGNCLMMTSSLQQQAAQLHAATRDGGLLRSQLNQFLADGELEIQVLQRGLDAANKLISSFQQVVVDRSRESIQRFALAELCQQLVQTQGDNLLQAGITLHLDLPQAWQFESYPAALLQVLNHLIENATQHAFYHQGSAAPQIWLRASSLAAAKVRLQVQDNGIGIAVAQQKQVFEPFFTSQSRHGRCGLGLSVCYNLVTAVLGGSITLQSAAGQGACFTLELPLVVPQVVPLVMPDSDAAV